jgi:YggT family protein
VLVAALFTLSPTHLLVLLLEAYLYLVMLPVALLSWFPIRPGTFWYGLQNGLRRLVEPVLAPVRRYIKPVGGLDLSFMVVFLGIQFLLIPILVRL